MNHTPEKHTQITFVRHGETDWNRQRRVQGVSDIPLNETGRAQAQATAVALSGHDFQAVFASPLSRAYETAQIISAHLGLGEPQSLNAVIERNYGEGEGLTDAEIERLWPDGSRVPGRETRDEVVSRAVLSLIDLAERYPGQHLLIVSHGGVIGSLSRHLTDDQVPAAGEPIPNGSVHHFSVQNGELVLHEFNLVPDGTGLMPTS